nr:alcohol dehydrogenase catalytic domain-containing protein [Sporolactobacillus laevolacticus]
MRAIIHEGSAGLSGVHYVTNFADLSFPGPGEVKVKLKSAGLNHRDLFVTLRHNPEDPSLILGSDGAGVVSEVGENVTHVHVGDEVVIIPSLRWKGKLRLHRMILKSSDYRITEQWQRRLFFQKIRLLRNRVTCHGRRQECCLCPL